MAYLLKLYPAAILFISNKSCFKVDIQSPITNAFYQLIAADIAYWLQFLFWLRTPRKTESSVFQKRKIFLSFLYCFSNLVLAKPINPAPKRYKQPPCEERDEILVLINAGYLYHSIFCIIFSQFVPYANSNNKSWTKKSISIPNYLLLGQLKE